MNRRDFVRLITLGALSQQFDLDKLLWAPGKRTFFLPSPRLTEAQIVQMEINRVASQLKGLFERDIAFYANIELHYPTKSFRITSIDE